MNRYQRALRDFQDAADDFSRSSYRNFDNTLRRLVSTVVGGTPLGDVVDTLPEVDFQAWYEEQKQSVGGFVGSGTLDWPDDRPIRLALQLEMLRALSGGNLSMDDITHNFIYVRNHYDDNIAEFLQQVF